MRNRIGNAGLTAAISMALLAAFPVIAWAAPVLPAGITAGSQSLAGMTAEEAKAAVQEYVDGLAAQSVTLSVDGQDVATTAGELGFHWINTDAIDEAVSQYAGGSLIKQYMIEKDLAAAEDVTQEVFLVAYQKWQEVRRHPNQKGFLLLTAKNKLKKWYEQQGKIQTEGPGQEEKAARRPDSGQEGYYVQAEWNAFLEQIFSMQELLIWKFYYENGFSCAEIGEKIGISESNTKVKLFRMRQKLKSCMEE